MSHISISIADVEGLADQLRTLQQQVSKLTKIVATGEKGFIQSLEEEIEDQLPRSYDRRSFEIRNFGSEGHRLTVVASTSRKGDVETFEKDIHNAARDSLLLVSFPQYTIENVVVKFSKSARKAKEDEDSAE